MVLEGESDQEGGDDDGEDEEGKEEGTTAGSKKDSRRREGQSKQATVYAALTLDTLPPVDEEWLNAAAQSMARRQDITMEEGVTGTLLEKALGLLGEGAAQEEQWEAFDPTALGEPHGEDEEEEDGGGGHMHDDFDHGGDDMEGEWHDAGRGCTTGGSRNLFMDWTSGVTYCSVCSCVHVPSCCTPLSATLLIPDFLWVDVVWWCQWTMGMGASLKTRKRRGNGGWTRRTTAMTGWTSV
jgi:hypothetical protein